MHDRALSPLALGGHSFFSSLGNEPVPGDTLQREIVAQCLDLGITTFDTTHQPERVALGKALAALGRRDEARIFAWNFLKKLQPGDPLDRPISYQPGHLDQLCEDLQTNFIDAVVIHDLDEGTPDVHAAQEAVARAWVRQGRVGTLGVWAPKPDAEQRYANDPDFTFMICPMNLDEAHRAPVFALGKRMGWTNYACSPFVRGWTLDKMVERALARNGGNPVCVRAELADKLLRYALYAPGVDRLITAIRRPEWVRANLESVQQGPLNADEIAGLEALRGE